MKHFAVLLTLFLGTLFSAEAFKCDAPFYAKLFKIPNLMKISWVPEVIQIPLITVVTDIQSKEGHKFFDVEQYVGRIHDDHITFWKKEFPISCIYKGEDLDDKTVVVIECAQILVFVRNAGRGSAGRFLIKIIPLSDKEIPSVLMVVK